MFLNALIFLTAAGASHLLTNSFINFSHRFSFLDYPGLLKKHPKPTPYLGGVAVFLSFWITVFAGIVIVYIFGNKPGALEYSSRLFAGILTMQPKLFLIFIGAVIILVIGLLDDRFHWSPLVKLIGQIIASFVLMSAGFKIDLFSFLGVWQDGLTLVWILLIINAFNFIDSLDGHCVGIAFISSSFFFVFASNTNQPLVGLLILAFCGVMLGFLAYNFSPAKVFLGDNGSLLVGYFMATFSLICKYQRTSTNSISLLIPLLIFGIPLYDTFSVILVRLYRRIPPWKGDRNHFAHRLVKVGLSEKAAVILSYFISFITGGIALLISQVDSLAAFLIVLIFLSIVFLIAFFEFYIAKHFRYVE